MAEENPNARLLAFSDGVIAVAITLLVLDIRLPEDFSHWSDAELWSALVALWPRLLAYLLSFFVIGNLWNSHRSKFEKITGSDARLCRSICFFLLTIGLVPFTTNLIAESGGTLSTAVYAASMVVFGTLIDMALGPCATGGSGRQIGERRREPAPLHGRDRDGRGVCRLDRSRSRSPTQIWRNISGS